MIDVVGVGLSYTINRCLDLRTDYGWQLRALPGHSEKGAQANIAITLSY